MTASAEILERIMERSDAPSILEKAQEMLRNEEVRRRDFYNWVTDDVKAEFINGEIIVHSPVRSRHSEVSDSVFYILRSFVIKNQIGRVTHEKVMARFTRNDYEPDVMFFGKEKSETIQPKQSLFPVPDFIVEIVSKATEERDRGVKFNDFEAHGVAEYWIIDAENEVVEQYLLKEGAYFLNKKTDEGIIHCKVISGLDIPIKAFFNETEHLAFIQKVLIT
jgi:Uma2 family endonuclease